MRTIENNIRPNQKHRSMAYFPAFTGRDEMSKQARFVIRMALACHEAGTPYDVEWKRIPKHGWMAATLTASGNLPMPKPFPKAPRTKTAASWKPNLYDASYRLEAALVFEKDGPKWVAGHVIEHSCGLSLVRFGDGSETGEIVATAEKDAKDGWSVTHTRSGRGMGFQWKFNDAVSSLLAIAHYCDWHQDIEALKDDEGARKAQLLLRSESCQKRQDRENAAQALERMGGPVQPPELPPTPTPAVAVRTRTSKPVDAVSKLAQNEARIAAIKAQLAKPADDVQAKLNRLLAELRANRPKAPEGKLAVQYPDGRVAYIPDPAAERRVSA